MTQDTVVSKIKVCHITTVHAPRDVRILYKECASLARCGFDTYLIARHARDEMIQGVKIIAIPPNNARGYYRLINMVRALRKALQIRAQVYHFHDPELLPVGLALKLLTGQNIIYDAHEDVQAHALSKSWKGGMASRVIAVTLRMLERIAVPFFSAVMIPVEALAKFKGKEVVLYNYPTLPEKLPLPARFNKKRKTLVYLGGIREKRCAVEMIEAVKILKQKYPDIHLQLLGPISPDRLETKLKAVIHENNLEENITMPGRVSWESGCRAIAESDIGLCVMYPDPDLQIALPTKMFEYMLYGKPAVVSAFPIWKKIVDETQCGVTVDSATPGEIADAIIRLYRNPRRMKQMGKHGQRAIVEKYSWAHEEQKLYNTYLSILSQ